MQSTCVNDIKIYNLSSGKSIPEWLSSRKKRKLLKSDASLRNRIQLIQDLEMPGVSNCVNVSPDGQYIVITGTYKPRIRCYDTNQLAMKFERCFDSEVIRFLFLAEDYSKLAFLQDDRWLEFHNQAGRYFRIRIPKAGRDMVYQPSTCDLLVVGDGSSVVRLNLEMGKFSESIVTDASGLNACCINDYHELFVCGSKEGFIEAWDLRSPKRVSKVDVAFSSVTQDTNVDGLPSISSLVFKDSLNLAVGTATGQILLYDIRSSKPCVVKDHFYGLPIKKISFIQSPESSSLDLVASIDSKIVKLWERQTGNPHTAIQTPADLNDMCLVPKTGMMFLANEDKKVLSYYIPSLGPAPKWCSFLDRIVEELEESNSNNDNNVYEDYKFVTPRELSDLGLDHLIGTNLLRAYMHGFFIDIRLYHKAKSVSDPFAYQEYKKKKIKEKLESERADRVSVIRKNQLPLVNRDLAQRLMLAQSTSASTSSLHSRHSKIHLESKGDDDNQGNDYADDEEEEASDSSGRSEDKEEVALDEDEELQRAEIEKEEEDQLLKISQKGSGREAHKARKKLKLKQYQKKLQSRPVQTSLLHDERFKALFENADFQVDLQSEEYKLMSQPGSSHS